MNAQHRGPSHRRLGTVAAAALALVTVAACDFDVTNPGPTQDEFLDSLNAHEAVVIGARRELSFAMQNIGYWGAAMTFEINPAGSTGSFGIETYIQAGRFDESNAVDWNDAQQARWVAENALERFETVLPQIEGAPDISSYEPAANAALWAGYANRLLGENFCQVVFNQPDGTPGSPQAHTAAFERAATFFRRARDIAGASSETGMAATAGLASVLGDLATYGLASWSDAVTEASAIPDDFVFVLPYSDQDQDQFNFIHFANGNEPYRAHTMWATWHEEYFNTTADPRVPWEVGSCPDCPDPANPTGDAAVDKFGGLVPWFTQLKFDQRDSPVNLSTGWEMRLIEAEAALDGGDFDGAEALMNQRINALNAADPGVNIPVIDVDNVTDGWTALKEQRQIELWMEGRRLGDVRRWLDNGVAGAFNDAVYLDLDSGGINDDPRERVTDAGRHIAWPIGQSEREVNPNVDLAPVFCVI